MRIEYRYMIAALLGGLSLETSSQVLPSIAGTYEIEICKSKCGEPIAYPVIALGILVLFDHPLAADEIAKFRKMDFPPPLEETRACFSGNRPEKAETYAFIHKRAAVNWSIENEVLKVELYRSADAGYNAEFRIDGDKLTGTGSSWGAGAAEPGFAHADAVVGRRIGPPNISACLSDIK